MSYAVVGIFVGIAQALMEAPVLAAAFKAFLVGGFVDAIYFTVQPVMRIVIVVFLLHAGAAAVVVFVAVRRCWHCRACEKQKPRCQNRCLHVHDSFDFKSDAWRLAAGAMLDG
jgi:hypothetical protein